MKPRGPVPYDAKDPRTWDHEATRNWLLAKFTKLAEASREAERRVQAKRPQVRKKTEGARSDVLPDILVDIDKLCPPGLTGRNLGALYTREFVERCLDSRPPDPSGKAHSKLTTDTLKTRAVTVIGELFYLTLTAKTMKRNAIMKSRKTLDLDRVYGTINHIFRFLQ
jgi:kinesin family member 2/24